MTLTSLAANRRVLVIDDNLAIHDDFRKILGGDPSATALLTARASLFDDVPPQALRQSFEVDCAHQGQIGLSMVKQAVQDLSKIEAGKMELSLECFDLPEMLVALLETMRPVIEKNRNSFVVNYGQGLGSMYADLTKTRQILFNLLSNAGKFTRDGTIHLEVTRGSVDSKGYYAFQVTDTGIGITPEQAQKLFQPFTQADASTTRQYGGTGLGLAIVWRFCQMMGGDVTVQSTFGTGTSFTVRLPIAVENPQSPGGRAAAPASGPAARAVCTL